MTGRVYVETETIKAVWHYKTLASESYNQGGGNLYELYYKPLDPEMKRNLVSFIPSPSWGNGNSTSIWAGIGGVGTTTLYATDSLPSSSGTNSFADIISDNNLSGTLESQSAQIEAKGNAELNFTYRVKNRSTGKEWYRAVKTWTVKQDGSIYLNVDWSVLRSGYYSEISVRSDWSYFAGWNRFSKYGKDWSSEANPKYLLGSNGIESKTAECWNSLNAFHPDWVSLTGSAIAPTLVMSADNDGQGFAGSGLYQLGKQLFGSAANPIAEQCTHRANQSVGAHGLAWMSWWGGNPPTGHRYRWVDAGTEWSDSFVISLIEGPPGGGPDISRVQSHNTGDSVQITWHTDVKASSQVQTHNSSNPWVWTTLSTSSDMVTDHALVLGELPPDQVYRYRVRSVDSAGRVAVSGNYLFSTFQSGVLGAVDLTLTQERSYWVSFRDYLARVLSVGYVISNTGPGSANDAKVTSSSASRGVKTVSSLPVQIGTVHPGSSARIIIEYEVPAGVPSFTAYLRGNALDESGGLHEFPH